MTAEQVAALARFESTHGVGHVDSTVVPEMKEMMGNAFPDDLDGAVSFKAERELGIVCWLVLMNGEVWVEATGIDKT